MATEDIIESIAKHGKHPNDTIWNNQLKEIFRCKMLNMLQYKHNSVGFQGPIDQSFENRCNELCTLLHSFDIEPPFTLQRLAELLLSPDQYTATHKLCNAIEKLLSVSSSNSNYN